MPSTELIAPLGRVMFPAFALVKDQPVELLRIVLLALSVQALIGIPAGVGVALVAAEAVPLLLGVRWEPAVPFVQILGLASVVPSMLSSTHYLLLALGKIRTLALFNLANFFALVLIILVAFPAMGAQGIAVARLVVGLVAVLAIQGCAAWILPGLRFRAIWRQTWRPITAVLTMTLAVLGVEKMSVSTTDFLILAGKISVGALTYTATIALLWRIAGCPNGGETYILEKLRLSGRLPFVLAGKRQAE